MKKTDVLKNNVGEQGNTTADRLHKDVKSHKKQQGISNSGGQRSDQTSNKNNERRNSK